MSQFAPSSYQNGYAPLSPHPQQYNRPVMPDSQPPMEATQQQRMTKFYKSGLFGFSSSVGNLQRDVEHLEKMGWYMVWTTRMGSNFFSRKVIVATFTRS